MYAALESIVVSVEARVKSLKKQNNRAEPWLKPFALHELDGLLQSSEGFLDIRL
jgi:phosphopantetheine adenylyltransferase